MTYQKAQTVLAFASAILLTPAIAQANDMNMVFPGMMFFPLLGAIAAALLLRRATRKNPEKTVYSRWLKIFFYVTIIPGYLAGVIACGYVEGIPYLIVLGIFCRVFYTSFKVDHEIHGRQEAAAALKATAFKWAAGLVLIPAALITVLNYFLG